MKQLTIETDEPIYFIYLCMFDELNVSNGRYYGRQLYMVNINLAVPQNLHPSRSD